MGFIDKLLGRKDESSVEEVLQKIKQESIACLPITIKVAISYKVVIEDKKVKTDER